MMRYARPVAGGWVAREFSQNEKELTSVGDRPSVSATAAPQTPVRAGSCESVMLPINTPTPTPTNATATELTPAKESSAASSVAETESVMGDVLGPEELADTEYLWGKYNRRFFFFWMWRGHPSCLWRAMTESFCRCSWSATNISGQLFKGSPTSQRTLP